MTRRIVLLGSLLGLLFALPADAFTAGQWVARGSSYATARRISGGSRTLRRNPAAAPRTGGELWLRAASESTAPHIGFPKSQMGSLPLLAAVAATVAAAAAWIRRRRSPHWTLAAIGDASAATALDSLLDSMEPREEIETEAAAEPNAPPPEGFSPVGLPLPLVARCWERSARNNRSLGSSIPKYSQEVLEFQVDRGPEAALPLGLDLEEYFTDRNGLGLVLVGAVMPGGAAAAVTGPGFQPGDTIVAVGTSDEDVAKVEGRNIDTLVGALSQFAGKPTLRIWVKRMVVRSNVTVTVIDPFATKKTELVIPSGRKLETALIDAGLSDPSSRTLSCEGNGVCGTCAVQVLQGADLLRPPSRSEIARVRFQPTGSRLACQARVGFMNQEGEVTIKLLKPPPGS
jgi:ferredoxin